MIEITKEQLKDVNHALLHHITTMVMDDTWREYEALYESLKKTYSELKALEKVN